MAGLFEVVPAADFQGLILRDHLEIHRQLVPDALDHRILEVLHFMRLVPVAGPAVPANRLVRFHPER